MSPPDIPLATGTYRPLERALFGPCGRIGLSPTEGRLLEYLAASAGRVVEYRTLLTEVWGYAEGARSRTVYTTVQRLRSKIEADPMVPTQLLALPGVGYRLVLPTAGANPREPRVHLPGEPPALIGREQDLAALRAALEVGGLVTLLGPGGVGKTSLALRVAHDVGPTFPGGTWFCDLTEARDREGVGAAVARGLVVSLGGEEAGGTLGRILAARGRALVVLDNLEQVLPAAAALCAAWRSASPQTVFLATSREAMHLGGERVYPLGPLPCPGPSATPDEIENSPAVRLFRARLRDVRPDFVLDETQRAATAELVRSLDGLPLAIELAAARGRALSPSQMCGLLGRRFELLAHQRSDLPARHATLRAVIDWSWDLLDPVEQAALAQLSVFHGGAELDAAVAVLDLSAAAPWCVDVLQVLVDRSLVTLVPPTLPGGDHRYGLYASIRAYATERLDASGLRAATEARHGAWFAREGHEDALQRLDRDPTARRRLVGDRDNLVVALRRAVARAEVAQVYPLARATGALLTLTGPLNLAVALLEGAVAVPGLPGAEAARLWVDLGEQHRLAGTRADAERCFARGEALARASGDPRALVRALHCNAASALRRGERLQGERLETEALRVAEEAGLEFEWAMVLGNRALHLADAGRADEAWLMFHQALQVHRRMGNLRFVGVTLGNIAREAVGRAGPAAALPMFEEALRVHRQLGNRRSEAIVLSGLATTLHRLGRPADARATIALAIGLHQEVGNATSAALARANLGLFLRDAGHFVEAEAAMADTARTFRQLAVPVWVQEAEEELGLLLVLWGRWEDARVQLATAAALYEQHRIPARLLTVRALLHLEEGEADEAMGLLDRARTLPGQAAVPYLLPCWALAAARTGDPGGAAAALTGAPEVTDAAMPGDRLLAAWLVGAAWTAVGDARRAALAYGRVHALADRFGVASDHPLVARTPGSGRFTIAHNPGTADEPPGGTG